MKKLAACLCVLATSFFFGDLCAQQCSATINVYPYFEDFENDNGSFTTGGSSSSWQYGVIHKPVITSAASGTKGWTTGGLTSARYNDAEDS